MSAVERVETAQDFETWTERGDASLYLIERDGEPGPYLVWPDDSGDWHGVRGISEDDGPWEGLPDGTKDTLGIGLRGFEPDGYGDDESFTPFTVLWHDSLPTTLVEAEAGERIAASIEARRPICPVHHMTDCSPLLNGCSLPNHLIEQREIDANIARGAR